MLLASVSSSLTSAVADHGVYAVFGLLALGALLPVGSELVALVGGAVAAGVLAGGNGVSVFGAHFGSGAGAYIAISLAATIGYLLGCLVGWLIGRWGGRELLEHHGRWFHVTSARLDRADAWLAITENRIGPQGYKPQDVVRASNGVTIQVIHTDAEGRMALADTLALAGRTQRPVRRRV